MDFWKLIRERYSVRKFKETPVEKEVLHKILTAGRMAPTSSNLQPQRIIVLQSKENLKKVKGLTHYHFDAPLILLICYDLAASWKNPNNGCTSGEIDTSIVTTHMMLAAADLGIGSTWVGYFDQNAVKTAFGLPDTIIPMAFMPMGYPADTSQPHPNHERRLEEEWTVFFEEFPPDY